MAVMNRLSPLIVRRVGRFAPVDLVPAMSLIALNPPEGAGGADGVEDLRLFLSGWLGGLVFFGTLLA